MGGKAEGKAEGRVAKQVGEKGEGRVANQEIEEADKSSVNVFK